MLGGTGVLINGLQLRRGSNIECMFDDQITNGIYVSESQALCVVPVVYKTGPIPLTVNIGRNSGKKEAYTSTFTICESINNPSYSSYLVCFFLFQDHKTYKKFAHKNFPLEESLMHYLLHRLPS